MYCEYCHNSFSHHPRCPNAPEPPIVCYCSECKEPVYDSDTFYRINEENYCEDCIEGFKKWADIEEYIDD